VWRLRAVDGAGWDREIDDRTGAPIVTATLAEAQQWPNRAEALVVARRIGTDRRRVIVRPVSGPATPVHRHGLP
jgi:hypothetical protein